MKNAILLHGTCEKEEYFGEHYPSLSNSHWFPWLQKQLLVNGIFTQTPEMPEAYKPEYGLWKSEFEKFDVNEESILVGHSCGGGFLVRWLSENQVRAKKLILVAPWLDPRREKTSDFFEFEINPNLMDRFGQVHLFVSTDDEEDILISVKKIQEILPKLILHQYEDLGHFCYSDLNSAEFPDLLEAIV